MLGVVVGIDIENNVYSPLGPGTLRIAVTAEDDIARSIARLAILSLDPQTAAEVPTYVRIAGQNVSYEEIRDAVARIKGVPKGEIKSCDLDEYKRNLQASPSNFIMDYVRCVILTSVTDQVRRVGQHVDRHVVASTGSSSGSTR